MTVTNESEWAAARDQGWLLADSAAVERQRTFDMMVDGDPMYGNSPPVVPVLDSITPTTIAVGYGALLISLHGSGFTDATDALINGVPVATDFYDPGWLGAHYTTSVVGEFPVQARTGGEISAPVPFTVTP